VEGERLVTRAVDREHKVRQRVAAVGELGETLGIGDQRLGAGIPQPVRNGVDADSIASGSAIAASL